MNPQFTKDFEKRTITVINTVKAPVDAVWRAWTKAEMLDQWWAPKPWKAKSKKMDFTNGGSWLYAMVGPDGTEHWAKVEFSSIQEGKSFEAKDMFTDANGEPDDSQPSMIWRNQFEEVEEGTKITNTIRFEREEDMNKILEMGFEEGFTLGLNNLDELMSGF